MFDKGYPLLAAGVAASREVARASAVVLARIAEFVALHKGSDGDFVHLEVAAAFHWTVSFAQDRIALAVALATRLPCTYAALRDGVIDEYKARRVMLATKVLPDELAGRVDAELAPLAGELNASQLNDRLRRAVARADPAAAAARAAAKAEARRVTHENLDDGAGLLQIQGEVERTLLAYGRIRVIAKQVKASGGDSRTLDQITADVALDCLAGKGFENAKVHVWLTLPATTALGVDDKPARLAGYGWLPAQRALTLAAQEDATWQRVLTDPLTGAAIDVGRHRYTPPAALKDHIRAIYPTCTGPGCRRPAHLCDLDHLTPFPAGPTTSDNIHPSCRTHHRAKTHGDWRVEKAPKGRGLIWTTKLGVRYIHNPEPIADPEPSTVPETTDPPGRR
jgi:hypothetical protein